jgi:hypothetical protein
VRTSYRTKFVVRGRDSEISRAVRGRAGLTDNSVRLWFAVFISVGTGAEYSWGGMVDGHLGEGEKVWLGARERMLGWRSGYLPGGRRFVRHPRWCGVLHGVPRCPPAPVPAAGGMGMGRVCLTFLSGR